MTRLTSLILFSLLGVALALPARVNSAPAPETPPISEQELDPEKLAKELAHDSFAVRERAAKALWKMGEKARPALLKAATGDDVEAAERAREILGKFDKGIYFDTPVEMIRLMGDFRSGFIDKQRSAIWKLVKARDKGVPTLRILLREKLTPENRGYVLEFLVHALRQEVPKVLFDGRPDIAEDMLSLNTLGTWTWSAETNIHAWSPGMLDYAVLVHLRGRGKEVAAELEKRKPIDEHVELATRRALIFALKAAGEEKKARTVAEKLAEQEKADPHIQAIYDSILEDTGAWADLAVRSDNLRVNSFEGLKMFRLLLAGKKKEADTIGDQARDAEDFGSGYGVDSQTMALMLNGRELDGINRMREKKNAPQILADVLAARLEFKEALEKVGDGLDKANDEEGIVPPGMPRVLSIQYGARKGRLLAQLGNKEAATQIFNKLAEGMTDPQGESQFYQIIRAEVRAGLPDLAASHLGTFLANTGREARSMVFSSSQNPFEALFDVDAEAAMYWWRVLGLQKPEEEKAPDTMKRVRRLLAGKATPAEFDHAVKCAARDFPTPDAGSSEGFTRATAIASAYRAAGKPELAIAELAKVADKLAKTDDTDSRVEDHDPTRRGGTGARSWIFGTDERVRLWIDLGDMLADRGKHRDAATRYEQGWRRFPDNPIPLYLSGRALVAAGDAKEGRRRIELAHWVALGNARIRGRFLEELLDRGSHAEIRTEKDLIRESGWVSELYIGNVWNQVGRACVRLKDHDGAADATRRAIHYLLRTPGISYVEGYAYLTVPQAVRVHTARSLVSAGKVDDGVALAKDCLKILPGNIDVPLGMVPTLEKLDRKKDADALFQLVWDTYARQIKDHPSSAWARNSAAWLAAGCKRELDTALAHAKKAVELEPDSKSYRETLAEVHFRRGERTDAVKLMQEVSKSDPRNHHYRRQLDRYRTQSFDSPLPESADN